MYEKIICENGKIYLRTDINQKIETINDLNVRELAEIDNKLEILSNEKKDLLDELDYWKEHKDKMKKLMVGSLILIIPIAILPMLPILKFIGIIGTSIAFKYIALNSIPNANNNINACIDTLCFINKDNDKLLEEKKKVFRKPKLSIIREGQVFDIEDGKELQDKLNIVYSYYFDKENIDCYFNSLIDEGYNKEEIIDIYNQLCIENNLETNKIEIERLIDIIFECMNEDKEVKIKKKTK